MVFCFFCKEEMLAQELGFSISYQFIQAEEWNKATQTYNFSRPFLLEKQPLLEHGFRLDLYYLYKKKNQISWGPSLSTSFNASSTDNPDFNVEISSILLDLGMAFQYRPHFTENNNLFIRFTPSITGFYLTREESNSPIVFAGASSTKKESAGVGLGLNLQLGYDLSIGNQWAISPVFGLNYDPIIWGYRPELVFNESSTGDFNSTTPIFRLMGGIVIKKK